MGGLLKKLLYIVVGIAAFFVLAAIAVSLFFDPNDYRDQIAEEVRRETGRELVIEGDLGLSVFPRFGIDIGRTTLGNAPGFGSEPFLSFGVMGGFMQPQGHAQVMIRLADHHQNPQAALDAPRWQVTEGRGVLIEPGFDDAVYEDLRQRGHEVRA